MLDSFYDMTLKQTTLPPSDNYNVFISVFVLNQILCLLHVLKCIII